MSQFFKSPDTSRFSRCLIFNLGSFFFFSLLKGLDDEQQEEGQLLGQFIYDEDGDSLQTFFVSVSITKAVFISEYIDLLFNANITANFEKSRSKISHFRPQKSEKVLRNPGGTDLIAL